MCGNTCEAGGWKRTERERTKDERARKKSRAVGKISVAVQNSFYLGDGTIPVVFCRPVHSLFFCSFVSILIVVMTNSVTVKNICDKSEKQKITQHGAKLN